MMEENDIIECLKYTLNLTRISSNFSEELNTLRRILMTHGYKCSICDDILTANNNGIVITLDSDNVNIKTETVYDKSDLEKLLIVITINSMNIIRDISDDLMKSRSK